MRLGQEIPNFNVMTTHGMMQFHAYIKDAWCVLFSHPKDFTPVCTTELGAAEHLLPEFKKRGVKVVGLSVDSIQSHEKWSEDIAETQGAAPSYPIIGDTSLKVSKLLDMLPDDAGDSAEGRTAMDNQTVRSVFVIGPDKTIKMLVAYPMSTGRSFEELLRVIDSLQLTAKHKVGTPAGWRVGDDVIILPSIDDKEAQQRFPNGWQAPKPYIRIVEQPR